MIEILSYEKVNKNKVIGYVDIKLTKWGVIIRRIAHLQNGENKWFNFPTFYKEQPDGSKKYMPYLQFENAQHNSQLFDKMGELVKEYCAKNKIEESKPLEMFEGDLPF